MNNRIISLLAVLLCTSVISASEGKVLGKKTHSKKSNSSLMKEVRPDKSDEQKKRGRQDEKKESVSDGRYSKSTYQAAAARFLDYSSTGDLPWPAKKETNSNDSK